MELSHSRASQTSIIVLYGGAVLFVILSFTIFIISIFNGPKSLLIAAIVCLILSLIGFISRLGVVTEIRVISSDEIQMRSHRKTNHLARSQITFHNAPYGNRGIITIRSSGGTIFMVRSKELVETFILFYGDT